MSEGKSKFRLDSIDILRGYSIFLMIWAHIQVYWLQPDSLWLISITFIILNPGGTSQFNYIAGIGFGLSWAMAEHKGVSSQDNFWQSMSRTIVMILLSFIYNIISIIPRGSGLSGLWAWNILQCIAFSRFLGTFLMRFSQKFRFILAIIQILLVGALTFWLVPRYESDMFAKIIFYIFFNPLHGDGILVFFPFFVIGSIIGENIQQIIMIQSKPEQGGQINSFVAKMLKSWLLIGICLFFGGILIGLTPTGREMDFYDLIGWANRHPDIEWNNIPLFLLPNSYAWSFYCAGFHLILTTIFVYAIDLKKKSLKPWSMFYTFGRYSLTIYFTHYLMLIFPMLFTDAFNLNYITIWPFWVLFFAITWLYCALIDWKSKGKVSFEYLILIGSNLTFQKIQKKRGMLSSHQKLSP